MHVVRKGYMADKMALGVQNISCGPTLAGVHLMATPAVASFWQHSDSGKLLKLLSFCSTLPTEMTRGGELLHSHLK